MAKLVMLTFDSTYGAQQALSAVRALEEMSYAWVDDVATVERHKSGRTSIHTPHGSASGGAWFGALGGMFLFWWFPPAWFVTAAVGGAAVGAGIGQLMQQSGLDSELTERAKEKLTKGTSALLLIGVKGDADQMAHAFEKYQPTDVFCEEIPSQVVDNLSEKLGS